MVKVTQTWVDAFWDHQVEASVMAAAWRHAKSQGASVPSKATARGVAGAYCSALQQVGWSSLAFNVVHTRQATPLHLDVVTPKTVLRHLEDAWAIANVAVAVHPWFTVAASKSHASRDPSPTEVCGHAASKGVGPSRWSSTGSSCRGLSP